MPIFYKNLLKSSYGIVWVHIMFVYVYKCVHKSKFILCYRVMDLNASCPLCDTEKRMYVPSESGLAW